MKRTTVSLLLALSFALSLNAGVIWKTKTVTDGENKGQRNEILSTTFAQAGDVRQQFEEVKRKDNLHSDKIWWLFKNKDKMLYIVNDKEKTILPMSIDGMLQMAGALGEMVKVEISDSTAKVEDLGSETIMGLPCRHVRISREYTMNMKIVLIKKTVMVKEIRDVWGSRKVEGLAEIGASYLGKDMRTGFEELDKMIEKEAKMMEGVGFPLKSINRQTQFSKKGKEMGTTTTTMEVLSMEKKVLDAAMFELPEGYEKVSLVPQDEEGGKKKKLGIF